MSFSITLTQAPSANASIVINYTPLSVGDASASVGTLPTHPSASGAPADPATNSISGVRRLVVLISRAGVILRERIRRATATERIASKLCKSHQ